MGGGLQASRTIVINGADAFDDADSGPAPLPAVEQPTQAFPRVTPGSG